MASISNDAGGGRRILFVNQNRDRKSIRLGKVSRKIADEVKSRVENIVAAAKAGHSIDGETADWLGKIGDELHSRLAAVGLVPGRQAAAAAPKLGDFLESYIAGRTDVADSTVINLNAASRRLVEFFGEDKPIDAFTVDDAKAWLVWMKSKNADATIGRTVRRARQFFQAAIDKELIDKNPFSKIKAPSDANEDRKAFVPLDVAFKVIDECPDAEWRLLFALSRFGGLRCPSEHLALTWPDVDWEREALPRGFAEDWRTMGADLPRIETVLARGVGAGARGCRSRHHTLP